MDDNRRSINIDAGEVPLCPLLEARQANAELSQALNVGAIANLVGPFLRAYLLREDTFRNCLLRC